MCIPYEDNFLLTSQAMNKGIYQLSNKLAIQNIRTRQNECYLLPECWHTIGQNIWDMVKSFLNNGYLLREISKTHITLVSKVQQQIVSLSFDLLVYIMSYIILFPNYWQID